MASSARESIEFLRGRHVRNSPCGERGREWCGDAGPGAGGRWLGERCAGGFRGASRALRCAHGECVSGPGDRRGKGFRERGSGFPGGRGLSTWTGKGVKTAGEGEFRAKYQQENYGIQEETAEQTGWENRRVCDPGGCLYLGVTYSVQPRASLLEVTPPCRGGVRTQGFLRVRTVAFCQCL